MLTSLTEPTPREGPPLRDAQNGASNYLLRSVAQAAGLLLLGLPLALPHPVVAIRSRRHR